MDKPAKPNPDSRLEEALHQAKENYDKYLRARADLDNFKKQVHRDREETLRHKMEGLFRDLLPVVDHLQMALTHAGESPDAVAGLLEGVALVLKQFEGLLERHGIKPIEALGKPFDPRVHEAIAHQESRDHPANTVVAEHQKGYWFHHHVLRASRVTVSK